MLKKLDVTLKPAPKNGIFPNKYYTTTNRPTWIRLKSREIRVDKIEMDVGIKINKNYKQAVCVAQCDVKKGDLVVAGEQGIMVTDEAKQAKDSSFSFMSSDLSSERHKKNIICQIAKKMKAIIKKSDRILFVVGPAVVHTGASKYLESLIKKGYVSCVFTGNGFATHDIEQDMFGTTLGVCTQTGQPVAGGHHHHLWTLNTIRKHGSIENAIKKGIIKKGVIYQLIKKKIPFVIAGSLRDDGPLPETITDVIEAQKAMRRQIWQGFEMAIMCASLLHSVATGNLLPDEVFKVVVDVNSAHVTKLADRGTTGSLGIITDVEFFLSELDRQLR